MIDSFLSNMPELGDRKPVRMQCSISVPEAAEIEKVLLNPALPFNGDQSTFVRTCIRAGLLALHAEQNIDADSFIQAIKPMLGSELLRWSRSVCETFAVACVDHLSLATDSGDPGVAVDVLEQVNTTVQEIQNKSARSMVKKELIKRGFVTAATKLRQVMLDEGHDVYHIDTLVAEMF